MRILITGAAGFIGSHLADRLLANGHEVVGIDNLTTGSRENLPEHPSFLFYENDITHPYAFAVACPGMPMQKDKPSYLVEFKADLIIHCAASYDDRNKWHRDAGTNVNGAINVAIAAREWGCPVVYFQTALCYGNNPYAGWKAEARESYEGEPWPLALDWETNPESSYAISKVAAEQYLRLSEVPLTVFRLANIYGPRNLSGPVPTFYKRLTEGQPVTVVDSRRDFVYIDDLLNLVMQAITNQTTGTYHVSTGTDYSIEDVLLNVADALDLLPVDFEVTARGGDDAPTILLDPSLTKAKFGWEATTELDEGILAAVEWYREHGVAQTFTHLSLKG